MKISFSLRLKIPKHAISHLKSNKNFFHHKADAFTSGNSSSVFLFVCELLGLYTYGAHEKSFSDQQTKGNQVKNRYYCLLARLQLKVE